jgi:cellulose synthase operon protein B
VHAEKASLYDQLYQYLFNEESKYCTEYGGPMNKLFRFVFFAVMLASILSSLVFTTGNAAPLGQTPTGTPTDPIAPGSGAVILFDMLGQTDTLLRGPYGTMNVRFGLPGNWAFEEGGSLQLIVTASLITDAPQTVADGQFIGSTLNVSYNKDAVATIPLLAGSNVTYNVPIPLSALDSPFNDGRHEISLFLDAGNDCSDTTRHTSIVISSSSHLTIPYTEQAPSLGLTNLPRPIYQRDSIFPVTAVLVVPDAPTAQEMQAALTVAATFGRMSSGEMEVSLVPMSGLTEEMRTNSQLIFVGKPSTLPLLQGVPMPSPVQSNAFTAAGIQEDDGVLQLALSPWNTGRAMLVVGGNSDAGVIKAAQALSSENIQTVGDHNLALIANVTPPNAPNQINAALPQEARTLTDLGYDILTMNGVGRSEAYVRFTLPPGYVAAGDTYLDLMFNHSGLLDFARSGLTVFMNGNLIGSVLLSQQTAATATQRIKIPLSSLTTSNNELRFQVDLAPLSQCSFLDSSNLWLTILPESVLNLPMRPATAGTVALRDLSSYPHPFSSEPTLSSLAFILAKNDPSTWDTAARIALQLGRQAAGALFNLAVAYDGEVPDDIRNNRNLIVIGLPANMQLLSEINESLPAPFEKGTNVAVLPGQQVAYRFPADSDLGFLELLASPWNSQRVILTVVGTSPNGVQLSGNALTNALLRNRLKGNFVLVNGESLSVADTRTGLGLASMGDTASTAPRVAEAGATAATEASGTVFGSQVDWIPLVVGGLLIAIVIVIIVAAFTRRRVVVR